MRSGCLTGGKMKLPSCPRTLKRHAYESAGAADGIYQRGNRLNGPRPVNPSYLNMGWRLLRHLSGFRPRYEG
jgi:hypothetical protein